METKTINETCPYFKKLVTQDGHWDGDNYCGYRLKAQKINGAWLRCYEGSCEEFNECRFK